MNHHLYLSVIPEALIVSMLEPEAFGRYFAVGTRQHSRGQAFYFEIDPDFTDPYFPLEEARRRCVPHADGSPKNSVYVAIYRALEHIPLGAFRSLYLTTDDGRVLGLEHTTFTPAKVDTLHLYEEFCPVTPRVASLLDPLAYSRFITRPDGLVSVPRLVFCELELGALANDPAAGNASDLPYVNIDHLRDCLLDLRADPDKQAKMVMRNTSNEVLYRTVRSGFFVGDRDGMLFYPMPSRAELEDKYRTWWRSAQMAFTS